MSQQIIIPGPGDLVADRYEIVDELGRGSYGVVYRARQLDNQRMVALKTLLPQSVLDQEVVARFTREAQLVSRLQHPNLITLFDYGHSGGLFYMVVEYIEGRSLADLISHDAPIAPQAALPIMRQILEALDHAHAQGIIHRDMKPQNILLLRPDLASGRRDEVVKLLDFGIAKLVHAEHEGKDLRTLTQAGHVLGTPHYMAPEQIVGDELNHQVDVYAMGVMLYELLVGKHPFDDASNSTAVMVRHLRDDPPPLPGALEQTRWGLAVRSAMAKQPQDRLKSARAMLQLLEGPDPELDEQTRELAALPHLALSPPHAPPPSPGAPSPAHGSPAYGAPAYGAPAYGAPAYGAPAPTRGGAGGFGPAPSAKSARPSWLIPALLLMTALVALGALLVIKDLQGDQGPPPAPAPEPTRLITSAPEPEPARGLPAPTRPDNPKVQAELVDAPLDAQGAPGEDDAPEEPDEDDDARDVQGKPSRRPIAKKPARATQPKPIEVVFATNPEGGLVSVNGEPARMAPFTMKFARSDKQVVIRATRQGYNEAVRTITLDQDQEVVLKLSMGRMNLIP